MFSKKLQYSTLQRESRLQGSSFSKISGHKADSQKVRTTFSLLGCLPQAARAGRATITTGCQDVSGNKAGFLSSFHYVAIVFSPTTL